MKLTGIFPQNKARTENKIEPRKGEDTSGKSAGAENAQGQNSADRVELSSNSREAGKIRQILDSTPAVRAERIEEIKGRIEGGEYQVDPNDVADKMLMSLLTDTMKE